MKITLFFVPIVAVSLSGCAMQKGDFPSLAKRPYEDSPAIPEVVAPPETQTASLPAALKEVVDSAVQQSNTAHQSFLQNLPSTKQAVSGARGAAPSSESWVVAQVQLSSLEMSRSPSVAALADIDSIYMQQLDREFTGEATGVAAVIAQSRDKIESQVSSQQREIELLKSRIR